MKKVYIIYETGTNKKMGSFFDEKKADDLLKDLSEKKWSFTDGMGMMWPAYYKDEMEVNGG